MVSVVMCTTDRTTPKAHLAIGSWVGEGSTSTVCLSAVFFVLFLV